MKRTILIRIISIILASAGLYGTLNQIKYAYVLLILAIPLSLYGKYLMYKRK